MKIGNVEFGPYPVFLAPMEDVTDIGFRLLCKRFGAAMVYSEFVAADALVRMVNRSLEKLAVCDDERPWPSRFTARNRVRWPMRPVSWWNVPVPTCST